MASVESEKGDDLEHVPKTVLCSLGSKEMVNTYMAQRPGGWREDVP